jgi:hypothetical protein
MPIGRKLQLDQPHQDIETPAVTARRMERERRELAIAAEQVRSGLFIADHEVDRWLDRLVDGDRELPVPGGPTNQPRQR